MNRSTLLPAREPLLVDPFSKKGALVLFWLLAQKIAKKELLFNFSINQAARELEIMPFTVHRVIKTLEFDGIIRSKGVRTKKRFYLSDPKALLIRWLRNYQIQRKSKLYKYTISDPKNFALRRKLLTEAVPAIHTAASAVFHAGVTNLTSTELYTSPKDRHSFVRRLNLVEQERGYEVLLIEPYYLELVRRYADNQKSAIWQSAFAVLTFLDLYHFPVRGREQAEALFRKIPVLKSVGSWSDFEAVETA